MSKYSNAPSSFQNNFHSNDIISFTDISLEETFELIDRILPIESCVRHQILPLGIIDNYLFLGMLNPESSSTLEEIRPLISSFGYKLKIKQIEPRVCQLVITEYFTYRCTPQQKSREPIVTVPSKLQDNQSNKRVNRLHDKPTLIVDPQENDREIDRSNSLSSVDFLLQLPPQQLWQELFSRMLNGGIGRLHFQDASSHGRILLTQDGVPQLSLNNLERRVYQQIIGEVKGLAKLPTTPLQAPKKVAIERYSGRERLLLRIKLTPGKYGDEATIQVLRGKALELYEQTHTDKMTEQALDSAQQLKKMLKYLQNNDRSDRCDRIYLELLSTLKEIRIEISKLTQS
jgi:type II secretory ATPase GspE/PulE/Tfp pilus assembly ATPase PilB-like protein